MEKTGKETNLNQQKSKPRDDKADGKSTVLAANAAMSEPYRSMGERLHEIIKTNAPALAQKTWYGLPAYANKDGKVICFFRSGEKFKERYMTLGFNQEANLDEGPHVASCFRANGVECS